VDDKETYRSAVVGGGALVLSSCVHYDVCVVVWVLDWRCCWVE
jgi:hypothetical protein